MRLSWVVRMMVGKIMMTRVQPPERRLVLKPSIWAKNSMPTRP